MEPPAGHQSEGIEFLTPIRTFQNGGGSPLARFAPTAGLVRQDRSKGRVFRDTHKGKSQEVPSVYLEKHPARVCLPSLVPFGLGIAPTVFTKVLKPVVTSLRRVGIRLIIYLDDLLF